MFEYLIFCLVVAYRECKLKCLFFERLSDIHAAIEGAFEWYRTRTNAGHAAAEQIVAPGLDAHDALHELRKQL